MLTLGSILYVHTVVQASQWASQMTLFMLAEPGGRNTAHTHTQWKRWLAHGGADGYLAPSLRHENVDSVRALTGRRTTWTGLCRAIVAHGFVQMVHIPLAVLWVRNVLPRDSSRPWKQGPT